MYFYLLSSLKRRLIHELRESFGRHPVYSKITPFIENKFAMNERPNFGIVVKNTSVSPVQLSAQNFIGNVQSHVMMAYLNEPSHLLEWVREDLGRVNSNGGVMPLAAGVYYIECLTAPQNEADEGTFVIDPLITVPEEPLILVRGGNYPEAQLQNIPAEKTLRLWENRDYLLVEGTDYVVSAEGQITFLTPLREGSRIAAEYRYVVPSIGPLPWKWNTSDWETLPGVVLAFGKRGKAGDKVAIAVFEDRVDTAEAFGGRLEVNFDLQVIALDPIQMEEIADHAFMTIWHEKRRALSAEGIEIISTTIGGEEEELYDETGDLNYHNASMSVQLQTDWEVHIPMPLTISRASLTSHLVSHSGLLMATVPIITGRNNFYERIG